MNKTKAPELLAPAGSPEALSAAVAARADAVYLGGGAFNARMGAKNFATDELSAAISLCHAHGVRVYATLNTLVRDRELYDALCQAEQFYLAGADALIVADFGLSQLLRRYFPDLSLHASTQAGGHGTLGAEYLAAAGFTRMVCARELSLSNLKALCSHSPIEIEAFVHGALCVSVSGQCLMSSMIGGRSGNRGECAQPCRLPYSGSYPLSLKDLCLAAHMTELLDCGVASLKIEGRMRSPGYVYAVTSTYRRLIDERRNATESEISFLRDVFSRSGFTDAYFTGNVYKSPHLMLGTRTDADKLATARAEGAASLPPEPEKIKITEMSLVLRQGERSLLTLKTAFGAATVAGDVPEVAKNKPITAEYAIKQLSKLGSTPFTTAQDTKIDIKIDPAITMSAASLNDLRRRAVSALTTTERTAKELPEIIPAPDFGAMNLVPAERPVMSAAFLSPEQITDEAKRYFDEIYLPLGVYDKTANGFIMPAVIYDDENETEKIKALIRSAVENGAKYAVISNHAQLPLVDGLELRIIASFRFNITNAYAANAAISRGISRVELSPELTLSQMGYIAKHFPSSGIVYGRLPLMTTERCIIRSLDGRCGECAGVRCPKKANIVDRTGAAFPIIAEAPASAKTGRCRSIIYNSVPIYMGDKADSLAECHFAAHSFLFTVETPAEVDEVIGMYKSGSAPKNSGFRRIK